jgi:hypothetical protein
MADQQSLPVEKLKAQIWVWLWPAVGSLLSGVALSAQTFLSQYLQDPSGLIAVRAIALSLFLVPLPLAAYLYFRPKFKHLPHLGVHQNIKTGEFVCSHCLLTRKLYSPLKTLKNNFGWQCSSCERWVSNPDYVKP